MTGIVFHRFLANLRHVEIMNNVNKKATLGPTSAGGGELLDYASASRTPRLSKLALATLAWGALSAPLMAGVFFLLQFLKEIDRLPSFPGAIFISAFGVQIVALVFGLTALGRVKVEESDLSGGKYAAVGMALSVLSWFPGWFLCLVLFGRGCYAIERSPAAIANHRISIRCSGDADVIGGSDRMETTSETRP